MVSSYATIREGEELMMYGVRIAFLMVGWGICTMALGAVKNFAGLIAVRFLLGAFEAGLFPGIIYCLTFWYKPDERALRAAFIVGCATLGASDRLWSLTKLNISFFCQRALLEEPLPSVWDI
jgi:MFS family permease